MSDKLNKLKHLYYLLVKDIEFKARKEMKDTSPETAAMMLLTALTFTVIDRLDSILEEVKEKGGSY